MWLIQSLYEMAIQALVVSDDFSVNQTCLKSLPGSVREDILNFALVRARSKVQLNVLLHKDIKVLNTQGYTTSSEDLVNIGKCSQVRVLVMNPPAATRFNHNSHLLSETLNKLSCLVKLHLQRNDGVTDDVMVALVTHTTTLQEIDVSGCTKLTDATAAALATLPNLQALRMTQSQVSDEGLTYLVEGKCALSLTELCMNSCKNITGQSFKNIVKFCQNLSILTFSNCPNMARGAYRDLETFFGQKKGQLFWTVNF